MERYAMGIRPIGFEATAPETVEEGWLYIIPANAFEGVAVIEVENEFIPNSRERVLKSELTLLYKEEYDALRARRLAEHGM